MGIVKRRAFGSIPPNLRREIKEAFPRMSDKSVSVLVLLGAVFGDFSVKVGQEVAYIRNGHVAHVKREPFRDPMKLL
jgi:hypothetical protein